jgi:hypothetical protein
MMMQRGDLTVLNEPFSHVVNLGASEVDGRVVRSERELITALRELATRTLVFFKDTTDFRYPVLLADTWFLREVTHTFIIRHPRESIASHYTLNPDLGRDEIGFAWLYEIYAAARAVTGVDPLVIDSDDLLDRPQAVVAAYCAHVQIPYLPEALSWAPTTRDGWGPAAHWHADAINSRSFERRTTTYPVDVEHHPVLGEYYRYHLPYYTKLHAHRLRS